MSITRYIVLPAPATKPGWCDSGHGNLGRIAPDKVLAMPMAKIAGRSEDFVAEIVYIGVYDGLRLAQAC